MKAIRLSARPRAACLGIALLAGWTARAELRVPSRPAEVTVFADRAVVTRPVEVDLPEGDATVVLDGLPDNLRDDSVQVAVEAAPGLSVRGTDLRRETLTGAADPRARAAEEAVRSLEDRAAVLNGQTASLQAQGTTLTNLTLASVKGDRSSVPPPELETLYRWYSDESSRLEGARQAVRRELLTVNADLGRAKAELASFNGQRSVRTLAVALRAEHPLRGKLRVGYTVAEASWRPVYEARAPGTDDGVTLVCHAEVRQRTGEDWTDATLTLSTAQPSANGRMPEFAPLYLRYPEPPAAAKLDESLARGAVAAAPVAAAPASPEPVQILNRGTAVSYRAALAATVPSDGAPHRVTLQELVLPTRPAYVCTPALDPAVFLRFHVTNGGDAPLLAGNVDLYRDGDLVGRSALDEVAPAAAFDLDFGRDQFLTVTRKVLVDRRSRTGVINRRDARERKVSVLVKNGHPGPVRCTIIDGLPVSQNAEITVGAVTFSEPPAAQDAETGKLTWTLDLPPRGERTLEFGYTVSFPQGKEVVETP